MRLGQLLRVEAHRSPSMGIGGLALVALSAAALIVGAALIGGGILCR